jgi:hypothetical protein
MPKANDAFTSAVLFCLRRGNAKGIAEAVLWLVSEGASYTTGAVLDVKAR